MKEAAVILSNLILHNVVLLRKSYTQTLSFIRLQRICSKMQLAATFVISRSQAIRDIVIILLAHSSILTASCEKNFFIVAKLLDSLNPRGLIAGARRSECQPARHLSQCSKSREKFLLIIICWFLLSTKYYST